MKMQIEDNNGIKVAVESPHDTCFMKVGEISEKMRALMAAIYSTELTEDCKNDEPPKSESVQKMTSVVSFVDRDVIRPRIPNNVVDINDLTIEKAVTENALVRCPYCGQAHCLVVPSDNGVYLMRRDFNDNEFGIVAEFDTLEARDFVNMCCKPETNRKAYYEDLQTMNFFYDTDFAVDNNTEIFCPVCCHSNTFSSWKDAFENPLEYFETEHLCDACGGEKLEKLIKKQKVYECDKCGLQTEFKED